VSSSHSVEGADLMKKVGEVVSRFSRFVICRSHKNAKTLIGKAVYSEKKELIGMVIDIFGPVERPYLKILKKNGEDVHTLYIK
jgi:rRNA processing protein Gar1